MGEIRIIKRSRAGRCVYCHDGLDGLSVSCPACHARWHADCCDPGLARCPTLGCPETPPGAPTIDIRPRSPRRRRPRPEAGWVDAWTGTSAVARRWLRVKIGLGFGLGGLILAGATAGIVSALLRPWGEAQPFLLVCLALGAVGALSVLAMRRASRLYVEVSRLLDDTRPALRFLSVVPPAEQGQRWVVRLEGPEGTPPLGVGLTDQLAPRWLQRRRKNEPVLVYGLDSPRGPYVIEMRDGRLALLEVGLSPRRRRRRPRRAARAPAPGIADGAPPELLQGRIDMSEPL